MFQEDPKLLKILSLRKLISFSSVLTDCEVPQLNSFYISTLYLMSIFINLSGDCIRALWGEGGIFLTGVM